MGRDRKRIRRAALAASLVAAIAAVVAASSAGQPSQTTKTLTVAHWGGPDGDAREALFLRPFAKAKKVKIVSVVGPIDYGKVKAMVDVGRPEWDLTFNTVGIYYSLGDKYFEQIDYRRDPKFWKDTLTRNAYGAPEYVNCEALFYRKDAFPKGKEPKTWQDFWNTEKFPGKRALGANGNVPWGTLETALLATGVPAADVYPVDFDRAFAALSELRATGHLEFWKSYSEGIQMLASGAVKMARMPVGPMWDLWQRGRVGVSWSKAICATESIEIVKGSGNYNLALDYMKYVANPERQAKFAARTHEIPVSRKAYKLLPGALRQYLPDPKTQWPQLFWKKWTVKGQLALPYAAMVERWTKWLISG